MVLRNSSLLVDFGDNISISVPLHAAAVNNTVDLGDLPLQNGGNGVVKILPNNYGSTCELHLEISHVYFLEGDFSVSVTALVGDWEETYMAENSTLLNVRNPVDGAFLVVDSAIAVQENVTASVMSSPVSRFSTYLWTLLEYQVMSEGGTRTSVILSTVTDVPQLQFMLSNAGDYLINVTIENELSISRDNVIVMAVELISSLQLSCDTGKHQPENAAVFDCIAVVEEGSDVKFVWDFGAGILVSESTGHSSSAAMATFPVDGRHNISVTVWNQLGNETAWKMVDFAENVFKLSAVAEDRVLAGTPVTVTTCFVVGSNFTTLQFDFGSGSHHLAVDPTSRTASASHVYRISGVYNVTIKAEDNAAVAETHVLVNVVDGIGDVDLNTVSTLVAGRHSVMTATFDGNFFALNFRLGLQILTINTLLHLILTTINSNCIKVTRNVFVACVELTLSA